MFEDDQKIVKPVPKSLAKVEIFGKLTQDNFLDLKCNLKINNSEQLTHNNHQDNNCNCSVSNNGVLVTTISNSPQAPTYKRYAQDVDETSPLPIYSQVFVNQLIPETQRHTQHRLTTASNPISSCIFSPDGQYFTWSPSFGIVKIVKWRHHQKVENINLEGQDLATYFDNTTIKKPDNLTFVRNIAEIDCLEQIVSLTFGSPISYMKHRRNLHRKTNVTTLFKLHKVPLILAIGLNSGKIRIHDGQTGNCMFILFDHRGPVTFMKFTDDGSLQLASVSKDECIKLWDMREDGNMYKSLKEHKDCIFCCDWSPTAPLLCSVGAKRAAFIWDLETYTIKHRLEGHLNDVVCCQFSFDGGILATACFDTRVCLWNPYTGVVLRQFCHLLPPPRWIYAGNFKFFIIFFKKFFFLILLTKVATMNIMFVH
jgi:WD40 repeat protein